MLQVNQKVKVKVLDIDRDRQRICLGLKQTQEDPWQKIVAPHKVGDVVEGRVTKIVAFGAFVEIYEGIEGLVHICELANRHVEQPDEVVSVGQQVRSRSSRSTPSAAASACPSSGWTATTCGRCGRSSLRATKRRSRG